MAGHTATTREEAALLALERRVAELERRWSPEPPELSMARQRNAALDALEEMTAERDEADRSLAATKGDADFLRAVLRGQGSELPPLTDEERREMAARLRRLAAGRPVISRPVMTAAAREAADLLDPQT